MAASLVQQEAKEEGENSFDDVFGLWLLKEVLYIIQGASSKKIVWLRSSWPCVTPPENKVFDKEEVRVGIAGRWDSSFEGGRGLGIFRRRGAGLRLMYIYRWVTLASSWTV